jgi:hypothetical protein
MIDASGGDDFQLIRRERDRRFEVGGDDLRRFGARIVGATLFEHLHFDYS